MRLVLWAPVLEMLLFQIAGRSPVFGNRLIETDAGVFGSCKSLTGILPARGNTLFRVIDGVLFGKDGKTIVALPAGRRQAEYVIGNQVTRIADQAFAGGEHLRQVTIPDLVARIGKVAFFGCENPKTVTIGDSVEIGRGAFEGCP